MKSALSAILSILGKGGGAAVKGVSGPLGWIATLVIESVVKIGYAKLSALFKKWSDKREVDKKAKDSMAPLNNAKTGEEIDEATDDALNRF